jgi:hypothetical protein
LPLVEGAGLVGVGVGLEVDADEDEDEDEAADESDVAVAGFDWPDLSASAPFLYDSLR